MKHPAHPAYPAVEAEGLAIGGPPACPTATLPGADTAAAFVLGRLLGADDLPSAAQMAGLQARIGALMDPTSPAALAELTRQMPLLEALSQRLMVEGLRAARPDTQSLLLRTALQAQQAYTRTYALLLAVSAPRKAQVSIDPLNEEV